MQLHYHHKCNTMCSVDRVKTFQCAMQLTTARLRHQSTSGT